MPDVRRGDRRHRSRGCDRRRRADRRGLVGGHAREGPQPPARARPAVRAARSRVERRDQVLPPALPRSRPVPRAAHVPPPRGRRRPPVRGRGQQPAVDGRRRRLPRRRQAPPLPRGRLQGALRARPDRRLRHRRLAGRLRRDGAVLRRGGTARRRRRPRRREPVRGVAIGPVPDAAGRRHVRRGAHHRGRATARLQPVPRPDGRELGAVRRPARVQQLRVLRLLRLPDRRQGRSRCAAAQRAAHRPVRDPARVVRGARALDASGRTARGVRYLDARRQPARGERARRGGRRRRVGDAAVAAAVGGRELVGARRPLSHVPLPDLRGRLVPVPAPRAPRPVGHAPPRRPHDRRRRRVARTRRSTDSPTSAPASSSTAAAAIP